MTHRLHTIVPAALAGLLLAGGPAAAHPHVWVTMKAELVYAPDGTVTGVRHAWTFDDMFSTFAVQGLEGAESDASSGAAAKSEPASKAPAKNGGIGQWFVSVWNWITGRKTADQTAQAQDRAPVAPAAAKPQPAEAPKFFTREQLAPLAEVNVTSLKDFDYFTFAKADGKKVPMGDASDYWLDYQDAVLTLHFTLPFKTPLKAQRLDVEVYDPSYYIDFSFAEKEAVSLVSAPEACKLVVARPQDATAAQGKRLSEQDMAPPNPDNYGLQFASKISVRCQ